MHDSFNVFTRKPCSTPQGILYKQTGTTMVGLTNVAFAAMQSNSGSTLVVKKWITALPFKKSSFCDQFLIASYTSVFLQKAWVLWEHPFLKVRWLCIVLLMLMQASLQAKWDDDLSGLLCSFSTRETILCCININQPK